MEDKYDNRNNLIRSELWEGSVLWREVSLNNLIAVEVDDGLNR